MQNAEKKYKPYIIALAILLPVLVAILSFIPGTQLAGNFNYHKLPGLNALLNGSTFLILILAYRAIRQKKIALHRKLMITAIVLSLIFFVLYVLYHAAVKETRYGGEGFMKALYYFILITHILLSAAIVPLVLITFIRGLSGNYVQHRKIARITFPLWLYVTFSGVLVYLMISPYYPQ